MDKELLEAMLIDYIDGTLNPVDRAKVEEEIAKNESAYRLYEQLREVIVAMDKSEKFEPRANMKASFQGANVALKIVKADDEVVNALVKSMHSDPNTNVRLAALEALTKFRAQPHVRKVLIESLAIQKDPVVQIALIQLLVQMKEKDAVK